MTQPTRSSRPVDAGTLWAGGGAAALVAGLVAIVGILLCRGVLDIPVLAPKGDGAWGDVDTMTYAVAAGLAALLATGVMHLLLSSAPQPGKFFGWIMAMVTVAGVVAPFAVKASTESRFATAAINLAIGIAIGTLVSTAARSAVHKAELATGRPMTPPVYPTR